MAWRSIGYTGTEFLDRQRLSFDTRPRRMVPLHEHIGYEHILVLSGSQRDQNGTATAGTLTINAPGTRHSVVSEAGCIVLAIYEKPVQILPARFRGVTSSRIDA